jgi:hypothetical protein
MTDRDLLLKISYDVIEIQTTIKSLVTEPQMLRAFSECQEKHRTTRNTVMPSGLSLSLQKKLIQALVLLITAAASALTTWAATH